MLRRSLMKLTDAADCQELQSRVVKQDAGYAEPRDGAGPGLYKVHRYAVAEQTKKVLDAPAD